MTNCKKKQSPKKGASISSSIFNLTNAILGAGCLMLPYDTMNTGYVLITIFNILIALLASLSFLFITNASEHTQMFSYRGIMEKLTYPWVGIFTTVCLILYTFGSSLAYAIIIKDDMFWWAGEGVEYGYKTLLMWGIGLFVVLPLTLLQKLDFLQYTSIIALVAIGYVIVLTIIFSCMILVNKNGDFNDVIEKRGEIKPFVFAPETAIAIPLMSVAYTGHHNAAHLYKELDNRSQKKSIKIVAISLSICFVCYLAMGIFGYLAFGQDTKDNIILNLNELKIGAIFTKIASVFMIIVILFSFPLLTFPMKRDIEVLIMGSNWIKKKCILKAKKKHFGEEQFLLDEEPVCQLSITPEGSNRINDFEKKNEVDNSTLIPEVIEGNFVNEPISDNVDAAGIKMTGGSNTLIDYHFDDIDNEEIQNDFQNVLKTKELWEIDETNKKELDNLDIPIQKKYDIIIGILIVLVIFTITTFVNSISDVVSFIGSLCGTPIVFIFPAIMAIQMEKVKKARKRDYILPYLVLIFGVIFVIMGLYSAISNQINKEEEIK